MTEIVTVKWEGHGKQISLSAYPDICPICNHAIDVRVKYACQLKHNIDIVEVIFQCPRRECEHLFIGYYVLPSSTSQVFWLRSVDPQVFKGRVFSTEITSISKNFVTIFNQAKQAESLQLLEIAGPGYRKALEFLIKDYQ